MTSKAIPYITGEFNSTPDIGWYGSAYLLTACAFQPVFGRVFMLFSIKKSYLLAMFFFEFGSLLCGVAPNSMTLIIGRAIAGFGSAGILTGSFVVVATAVPLQLRPVFMAVVGLMFGVGASVGPLLGGVFTDLVTWRWCFYINLPVGAATVAAMVLFFSPRKHSHAYRSFFERFMDLDIVGNVLLLGASLMLFLALEFTTLGAAWSSAKIIGLLIGFGVVSILFTLWQRWKGEGALMPPRILQQRTVAASCGMAFMTYGAIINLTFFLPIWFQAIRGDSAIISGVNMIPYFAVNAFFSLLAGIFVSMVGYVTPPAVIGSAIGTIGLGLLTLMNVNTTTAQWVGYEILASAGFGLSIQQGFTAVQTVLEPADMAVGTAAVVASQSLGGAIFLSVGNSVFQNHLLKASADNILPGVNIKKVIDAGAAAFRELVPDDDLPIMLEVYNEALRKVFIVGIPLGALAAFISCFIEFKSVKAQAEAVKRDESGLDSDHSASGGSMAGRSY
ncbi:major facilitator superfamily domain-containing protein [Immersiella caudata]|uniref:Major facilitator superfamily domain-containing protein n=1 Tax=Immersiella caudata TaxID=314043 RepID=A0AA39XFK0_9PEZI|nr:major facilitator superfamily domain-containing protein [Immersiella caudata]